MSLVHTLALVVVALAAAVAWITTVATWRVRRATPHTTSLVAACAACVGLLLAAADAPIPAPSWLCTEQVATRPDPRTPLAERLAEALGWWGWWIRPCGRLDVEIAAKDLVAPINLGSLVDLATRAGVVVDVRFPAGMPPPGQELALMIRREGAPTGSLLPTTTPIPLSFTDMVEPRLSGAQTPECQIDDGAFERGDLDRLLVGANLSEDARLGFHRLRCRSGEQPEALVSTFVQIVSAGVVFASSDAAFVEQQARDIGRTEACVTPAACLGLRLDRTTSAAIEVPTVVHEARALEAASMLVLDRPQRAESCDLAERLLRRGATVVVAMPGEGFFSAACKQWFPVKHHPDAEGWIFDRTPRLTFAFDTAFEADLKTSPSAVIDAKEPCPPNRNFKESLPMQRERAEELCAAAKASRSDLECAGWGLNDRQGGLTPPRFPESAAQSDGRVDCWSQSDRERLKCSAPTLAIARFATELARRREAWENEVLVVFTHDHRSYDVRWPELRSLASRTSVARIDDPYGISLSRVHSDPEVFQLPETPEIIEDDQIRRLEDISGDEEIRCNERSVPSLARLDVERSFKAEYQTQAEFTQAPGTVTRFPRERDTRSTPAPVRFGWWARAGVPSGPRIEDKAVELAVTTKTAGIVMRPLVTGAMVDAGHLLFLGYSPVAERARGSSMVLEGMRMIEDIYAATEDFIGEVHGEIVAVTPRPDGALWVAVARSADAAVLRRLDGLTIDRFGGGEFVAPLVDLAHDRGIFTYALPAAELERLDRCRPIQLPAVSEEPQRQMPAIHACPPDKQTGEGGRLAAVAALEQLAHFTGGHVIGPDDRYTPSTVLRTRTFGLGLLALSFLFAWGRRAIRRLAGVRASHRLGQLDRIAQRRYDPPDAVVAAAGDWDGRATTWPRTGAFGGYRPIEPGDRVAAAVLVDLLVRRLNGTELLPRVALRIEESAPAVVVLVNLGASMRVGGDGGLGKAPFAGRVAMHVAASAWKIGGEVAIFAAGVEGELEVVAPSRLGPAHEEVAQTLRRRLEQPAGLAETPWPAELAECGALVYVSDMQYEDEEALHRWLTRLEGAGVRVGGVMIYSPQEFTMVEGGRLAGSGAWADRADWEPDDVFAAFGRRRDQIERIFDVATTGGLVVAATTYHQDDIEQALASGRLLHILR